MDLLDGDWVKEVLDQGEEGAESERSVDDVELAEALWIVVLGDCGGLADVSEGGLGVPHGDTLKVHNGAAGLEEVAGLAGASWEARVGELLVLDGEVLEHALLGCEGVHGWEIDLAELLDVKWATILEDNVSGGQTGKGLYSVQYRSCGSTVGSTRRPWPSLGSQSCGQGRQG